MSAPPLDTEEFLEACQDAGEEEAVTSRFTFSQLASIPDEDLAEAAIAARRAIFQLRSLVEDYDVLQRTANAPTRLSGSGIRGLR